MDSPLPSAPLCQHTRLGATCTAPATHTSTWPQHNLATCPRHASAVDRNATRLGEPKTMRAL